MAVLVIALSAAGTAGADPVARGTDQVTSTPSPTTSRSAPAPGSAIRYVSELAENPGDQAYCNLQADRANLMVSGDPTSAVWVVESANANGCKIIEG